MSSNSFYIYSKLDWINFEVKSLIFIEWALTVFGVTQMYSATACILYFFLKEQWLNCLWSTERSPFFYKSNIIWNRIMKIYWSFCCNWCGMSFQHWMQKKKKFRTYFCKIFKKLMKMLDLSQIAVKWVKKIKLNYTENCIECKLIWNFDLITATKNLLFEMFVKSNLTIRYKFYLQSFQFYYNLMSTLGLKSGSSDIFLTTFILIK